MTSEDHRDRAGLAALKMGDQYRMTCVGCSEICERAGLLVVEEVHTIGQARCKVYVVAPGHTLEECRTLIKERHVPDAGNPLNS